MKVRIFTALIGLMLVVPAASHADFRRVCRGASLYKYDNQIKQAIRAKLTTAGIAFKSIKVDFTRIVRPKDLYVNDFASDITLADGATPAVSFTGDFPANTPCDVALNVKITVTYPDNTRVITVKRTTAPGTLLPALPVRRGPRDE